MAVYDAQTASLNRGVAERSNAAVLKTVEPQGSGGSNPSSSAKSHPKAYKTSKSC